MLILKNYNKLRSKGLKTVFIAVLSILYQKPFIRRILRKLFPPQKPLKWVFLVGCYSSGTTITHKILNLHPDIQTAIFGREGVHYTSYLPKPDDLGWQRMWIKCADYMQVDIDDHERAIQVKKDWGLLWRNNKKIFLEKSITNVTRIKWFDCHFPNSYFIGITRNGYCVSESIARRAQPSHSPATNELQGPYPLEWCGKQWVDANERLLSSSKLVQNYLQFSYEDFTSNPIPILEKLWSFLGLSQPHMSFIDGLLEVNGQRLPLTNMNKKSLGELSEKEKEILSPIIDPMMEKLGY